MDRLAGQRDLVDAGSRRRYRPEGEGTIRSTNHERLVILPYIK
jgi:hypothetical protein